VREEKEGKLFCVRFLCKIVCNNQIEWFVILWSRSTRIKLQETKPWANYIYIWELWFL